MIFILIENIKKKYIELSTIKKSMLWYTLATFLQKGISFIITPFYTRVLTGEEYGLYSVYQSWLQIVSIVAIIALDRCVVVGFIKFENERKEFVSSIQLLMTLLIFIWCAVALVFEKKLGIFLDIPNYLLLVILITALLSNSLSNWMWYQRYENNYKGITFYTVISTLIIQLFSLGGAFWNKGGNKGEYIILGGFIAVLICYGAVYIDVFKKSKININIIYWKFAITYSVAVLPHALAQIILNVSDRIMIDKLVGRDAAGYYALAYNIAAILNILIVSVNGAIQPWYYKKIKEKDYVSIREQANKLLTYNILIVVLVVLMAPDILMILAPASYYGAVWVIPSVTISSYFYCLFLFFSNFESFYEKPIYFSIATGVAAVCNIALNFLLIPKWGYIAAGYTTLVCYIIYALMHYFFMRKICNNLLGGVQVFDIKYIIKLSIIMIGVTGAIMLTYSFRLLRYFILLIQVGGLLIYIKKSKKQSFNDKG